MTVRLKRCFAQSTSFPVYAGEGGEGRDEPMPEENAAIVTSLVERPVSSASSRRASA
ncbi:hypothetical protein [Streptomyces sp. NPDC005374]|uniref:hypothetical protein n=1 Tax=Streptomyces sp. NPDC005374 TaxID=3364713 RepID=UPI0036AD9A11